MDNKKLEVVKTRTGFIAALDQSGGSSAKTLEKYGIKKDEYQTEEEMFDLIHQMRTRVITSSVFNDKHILGTILFYKTMMGKIEGEYSADYLWNKKNIVSFLKGNITSKELNNKFMTIKENYPKESFKANLNLISSHDVARIKTELNYDEAMVKLAVATQMTFEGVPYIYYGDEAGLCGGTDPDNRKTYPWKNEDEDMIEFYKEAINTRKKYSVLTNGDTEFIDTNDDDVFGYIRFNDKCEKILILINRRLENKNI